MKKFRMPNLESKEIQFVVTPEGEKNYNYKTMESEVKQFDKL